MKVYFIGAGPGDPELLTIKGYKILNSAECVIYPGSLLNKKIIEGIRKDLYDSSKMKLEQIIEVIEKYIKNKQTVVRLVSGDASLYSAIQEQIEILKEKSIPYEIIPGISSAFAASAKMGIELTIPEVSQTVIFTRIEGKTGGTSSQDIKKLASVRATMVFFLSSGLVEEVEKLLLEVMSPQTPVAIVNKVTWDEEKIIHGTLIDLSELMKKNNIKKTSLIFVGESLKAINQQLKKRSKLYDKKFNWK